MERIAVVTALSIQYSSSSILCLRNIIEGLSDNYMILVGKFDLKVIDSINGEVCCVYPGIDRGAIINLTENYDDSGDLWVVSEYQGYFFEFYKQEGNDLIYCDKFNFDYNRRLKWNNTLVKINKECFALTNWYGEIFVFKYDINNN